ncbi:MAG: carbon monoxide dehydrogenase subunit G [Chloroflexota bacterium]
MKIEGSYTFEAPREIVWETLMDPDALSKAIPGGEKLEKVGENQYEAALNVRVGPVQGKFDGGIELSDINEPDSYHMSVNGQGPAGFLNGGGDVTLSDSDEGTLMNYSGEAQVGGKIAGVGQRLIDSSAKSLTRQGLQALDAQIQAKVAGKAGEEVPEIAAPSAVGVAATVAADVAKDTVSDIVQNISGNEGVSQYLSDRYLPYTLGVGAIVVTVIVALLASGLGALFGG